MKKYLLILGILTVLFAGCQQMKTEAKETEPKTEISLTSAELKNIQNKPDEIRLSLIKKSILKEMAEMKYSEEEKTELKNIKEEIDIEYFLNKTAMAKVNIADSEVLEIYQKNIDKLKDYDINSVLAEIKNNMIMQQLYAEKLNYVNSLIEKYNIEQTVQKYVPEQNQAEMKSEAKKQTK